MLLGVATKMSASDVSAATEDRLLTSLDHIREQITSKVEAYVEELKYQLSVIVDDELELCERRWSDVDAVQRTKMLEWLKQTIQANQVNFFDSIEALSTFKQNAEVPDEFASPLCECCRK